MDIVELRRLDNADSDRRYVIMREDGDACLVDGDLVCVGLEKFGVLPRTAVLMVDLACVGCAVRYHAKEGKLIALLPPEGVAYA